MESWLRKRLRSLSLQRRIGSYQMSDDIPLPQEERIRLRAIELWKAEGSPHDRHNEFWEIAKAQILEEDLNLPPRPPKP